MIIRNYLLPLGFVLLLVAMLLVVVLCLVVRLLLLCILVLLGQAVSRAEHAGPAFIATVGLLHVVIMKICIGLGIRMVY